MRKVPLGGKKGAGLFALIDDEDLQLVAQYSWHLDSGGYAAAVRHIPGKKKGDSGRSENVRLHRLVMGFPEEQVDHRDRNRLNCQKLNLRKATHTQNTWNMKAKVSVTGFIGVRQESENVFCARLGGAPVGYYKTAIEAAQARDLAAIVERGEFAVLNFAQEALPEAIQALPPRNDGPRTSSTVGVSFAKNRRATQKWRAVHKKKHLGWFHTEGEAIKCLEKSKCV